MEKENENSTVARMEHDLKMKMFKLIGCEIKDLPTAYRSLNECVQSYCTFRTLLDKYNENNSAE